MKKALFLDRDGVINKEKNYLYQIEDFEFIDGVFETCKYFQDKGYLIMIITNQAGIARGKYTEEDYQRLTQWMIKEFKKENVTISKVYHCPHHPDFNNRCECRKPKPKMILDAKEKFDIDLNQSILVGDKNSDIEAGISAGVKNNFLITTGHEINKNKFNVEIIDNLTEIKKWRRKMKKTLVILLGLPRSGTTMATAMFDVHPNISAWFEPWHARQKLLPTPLQSIEDFTKQYKKYFNINIPEENILMFKETTTNLPAIEWTANSIENMLKVDNVNVKIIWLIRDINHAYLSRVHTAKEHWGHPDMQIDVDSFKKFVNFAFDGFKAIQELTDKYDSCMLSYEKLVSDTENTLSKVMNFIEIDLHQNQLEYHKHFKNDKSAGDPGVTKEPKPVTTDKTKDRDKEWDEYKNIFLDSLNENELQKYNKMINIVRNIRENGFSIIE